MKQVFVFIFILMLGVNSNSQERVNAIKSLESTKNELERISSAEYSYTDYFLFSGQLTPEENEINRVFIKELVNDADTIIGASFFQFNIKNKDELLFAYDGNVKVKLNWSEKNYKMFDYRGEPWYKRSLMAPFFTRSLAVVNYALYSDDKVLVDQVSTGKYLKYTITIVNREIEFVGKISDDISRECAGGNSKYELWVDANTLLPYKLSRTLSTNTIVEEISEIKINQSGKEEFIIKNYVPDNFSLKIQSNKRTTDLLEGKANNIEFSSQENTNARLYQINSEVIILQFTSHFCGPCKSSKSALDKLQRKYADEKVKVIALYNNKEEKLGEKLENETDYTFTSAFVDQEGFRSFGIELLPTFIILDKDKMVSRVVQGYTPTETDNIIDKAVKELLQHESDSQIVSR
ncbi:MAG: redoxin family protein [Bacteroidales bacterium]|nr:redoxin family protein [Bacteroidales bacterium]